jgi:hypothetical protein
MPDTTPKGRGNSGSLAMLAVAADPGLLGCLSQSNIDGVPSAQPDIAAVDQLPDLGFQLTLVFNAGRRSVNLDHPVGTMATNANCRSAYSEFS